MDGEGERERKKQRSEEREGIVLVQKGAEESRTGQSRVIRFLELVSSSCGCRACRRRTGREAPRLDAEAATAATRGHEKRRRGAAGAPGSRAGLQWRSTLGAISEHRMLRQKKVAGEDKGRRQGSAAHAARASGQDYRDDDRLRSRSRVSCLRSHGLPLLRERKRRHFCTSCSAGGGFGRPATSIAFASATTGRPSAGRSKLGTLAKRRTDDGCLPHLNLRVDRETSTTNTNLRHKILSTSRGIRPIPTQEDYLHLLLNETLSPFVTVFFKLLSRERKLHRPKIPMMAF
ncbi:hypothetical protein Taro_026317 [Colocasia esculenta]|uniref:Uncharacterized protein n=1 Tax=Colocasia esculenta TaxID=4460 RepID=A0A843VB49_COLES|nr:hypothetical protein [Colocasia esculenta]